MLPNGAKGIEAGNIILTTGRDKLIVARKGAEEHYTLQSGTQSGIIDLHRTWTSDGETKHETLFAIKHDRLPALLNAFAPLAYDVFRLLRPLRVGWLHRHGIGIVHGLEPTTDEQLAAVTTKRKRRLVANEERWQAAITVPEFLDDVYDFPDGAFSLFKGNNKIGIGFKNTDENGQTRLRWLKITDLNKLMKTGNNASTPPCTNTRYPQRSMNSTQHWRSRESANPGALTRIVRPVPCPWRFPIAVAAQLLS